MSVQAMEWAGRQMAGSPAAKLVLLVLADNAGERGACWLSRRDIAVAAELSLRGVALQLALLEERGLLTRSAVHTSDGSRRPSVVHLALPDREGAST